MDYNVYNIHKNLMNTVLLPGRGLRVVTVGIAATVALYAMVLVLAEPFRGMAADSSSNTAVTLTVAAAISNSCTSSVSMGTITGTGDSDSGGFNAAHAATCTISTNNYTGYSLGWRVTTGTGAAGARTQTGHLNGYKTTSNVIRAYTPAVAGTPETLSVGASDSRWAARLSSTSTTPGGAISWGSDGASDTWLNVATGSVVTISNRSTATSFAGDTQLIGFRAIIGSSKIQPTDTYKAIVVFTATTN